MTLLQYGNIILQMIVTKSLEKRPVFSNDGVDYLYTHYIISVTCLFNRFATAYQLDEDGTAQPTNQALPVYTEEAIKAILMQPRLYLNFSVIGVPVVSPQLSDSTNTYSSIDAKNGPSPISCNITRIDGAQTFHVDYALETWINDCDILDANPPQALLSNRFTIRHSIDDQHRTIRTVEGLSEFRIDGLTIGDLQPDDFRSHVFPPLVPGFQRESIDIILLSALNQIQWSCRDVEKFIDIGETDARQGARLGWVGSGVVKVEADYTTVSPPITDAMVMSPFSFVEIDVKCWGNKYSNNYNLVMAAFYVAYTNFQALEQGIAQPNAFLNKVQVDSNLTGRFVRVALGYKIAPQQQNIPNAGWTFITGLKVNPFPPQGGINPSFPNDFGTRGTAIEELMGAFYAAACLSPKTPDCPIIAPGYGQTGQGTYCSQIPPAVSTGITDVYTSSSNQISPSAYPQGTMYNSYKVTSNHTKQYTLLQLPIADPTDPGSSIVKVGSAFSQKVVSWSAERIGQVPTIPNPQSLDQNLYLAHTAIGTAAVKMIEDGSTPMFTVAGIYTYFTKTPVGAGDALLQFDVPPWSLFSRTSVGAITQENYSNDISG